MKRVCSPPKLGAIESLNNLGSISHFLSIAKGHGSPLATRWLRDLPQRKRDSLSTIRRENLSVHSHIPQSWHTSRSHIPQLSDTSSFFRISQIPQVGAVIYLTYCILCTSRLRSHSFTYRTSFDIYLMLLIYLSCCMYLGPKITITVSPFQLKLQFHSAIVSSYAVVTFQCTVICLGNYAFLMYGETK